jgi:hypothetical protein
MTAAELYERAKYFFPPPPLPELSINDATRATNNPGVYFLYQDAVIVYVGESLNVRNRLVSHEHKGCATHFSVCECDKTQRKRLEAFYIGVLNPRLNTQSSERVELVDAVKQSRRSPASMCRRLYSFVNKSPGCSLTDLRKAGGWRNNARKVRTVIDRMVEWRFVREEVVAGPGRSKRIYFSLRRAFT